MDKAFDWLRAKGAAKASDLGKREANEGIVSVSQGSDFEAALVQVRGVLCRQQYTRDARAEPWPMADRCPPPPDPHHASTRKITCETDFSARNETFQEFAAAVATAASERVPPPPSPGVHTVTLPALLDQPLATDGGNIGLSVSGALAELVGKIRENISVKQASKAVAFQVSFKIKQQHFNRCLFFMRFLHVHTAMLSCDEFKCPRAWSATTFTAPRRRTPAWGRPRPS